MDGFKEWKSSPSVVSQFQIPGLIGFSNEIIVKGNIPSKSDYIMLLHSYEQIKSHRVYDFLTALNKEIVKIPGVTIAHSDFTAQQFIGKHNMQLPQLLFYKKE